ncbi:MAG: nucleotidyltransferase family protein [Burkholderiales bacterium]|nr:nucleotidyltransferase family protein [Burkholderiales bacterium]
MIACILLAAGSASRFGSQKLLARLPGGAMVVEASIANLRAGFTGEVVAVTRSDPVLISVLEARGCRIVINDAADQGMGTSISAGVAATYNLRGWMIALGDMPFIGVDTIAAVAKALREDARIAIPVMAGKRGHPVGFSARYRERLIALTGDRGARDIIRTDAEFVTEVHVDDAGIFSDIDTPLDLTRESIKGFALPEAQNLTKR